MRRVWSAIAGVVLCLIPALGMAQEGVPGADDPALVVAIEQWLEGEDLPALEAFSALAKGGNVAAQMLLSGIDDNAHMHRHVTKDIPRKERIALMRVPKGISGKSWLSVAANAMPLADVLDRASRDLPTDFELDVAAKVADVRLMLEYGETQAALRLVLSVKAYGTIADVLAILQALGSDFPAEFVPLLQVLAGQLNLEAPGTHQLFDWWISGVRTRYSEPELAGVEASWRLLWLASRGRDFDAAVDALTPSYKNASNWRLPLQLCAAKCSQIEALCTLQAAYFLGYFRSLGKGSPRASVIADGRYITSARAIPDFVRYTSGLMDSYGVRGSEARGPLGLQCFFAAVEDGLERLGQN